MYTNSPEVSACILDFSSLSKLCCSSGSCFITPEVQYPPTLESSWLLSKKTRFSWMKDSPAMQTNCKLTSCPAGQIWLWWARVSISVLNWSLSIEPSPILSLKTSSNLSNTSSCCGMYLRESYTRSMSSLVLSSLDLCFWPLPDYRASAILSTAIDLSDSTYSVVSGPSPTFNSESFISE